MESTRPMWPKSSFRLGDTVENEQILMELETDKAVVELPADFAGQVTEDQSQRRRLHFRWRCRVLLFEAASGSCGHYT